MQRTTAAEVVKVVETDSKYERGTRAEALVKAVAADPARVAELPFVFEALPSCVLPQLFERCSDVLTPAFASIMGTTSPIPHPAAVLAKVVLKPGVELPPTGALRAVALTAVLDTRFSASALPALLRVLAASPSDAAVANACVCSAITHHGTLMDSPAFADIPADTPAGRLFAAVSTGGHAAVTDADCTSVNVPHDVAVRRAKCAALELALLAPLLERRPASVAAIEATAQLPAGEFVTLLSECIAAGTVAARVDALAGTVVVSRVDPPVVPAAVWGPLAALLSSWSRAVSAVATDLAAVPAAAAAAAVKEAA